MPKPETVGDVEGASASASTTATAGAGGAMANALWVAKLLIQLSLTNQLIQEGRLWSSWPVSPVMAIDSGLQMSHHI